MDSAPREMASTAWLPLSPSGVAAFARATVGRLWLVQLIVAMLTAAAVVVALRTCWVPTITLAIESLPEHGAIRSGRLDWTNTLPQTLAEGRFIGFTVDPEHSGEARPLSQVQVEFGRTDVRFYSIFGEAELAYPANRSFPFNFPELKPWWGAWMPFWLAGIAGAVMVGLFCSWLLLGTLYSLVSWLIGLFFDRDLNLGGSWLLSGAALVPGALMMAVAIVAYEAGRLDLVYLAAAWVFHLVLGWAYVVLGTLAVPKTAAGMPTGNPFKAGATSAGSAQAAEDRRDANNPFRTERH